MFHGKNYHEQSQKTNDKIRDTIYDLYHPQKVNGLYIKELLKIKEK